jgi:hypothetical protein
MRKTTLALGVIGGLGAVAGIVVGILYYLGILGKKPSPSAPSGPTLGPGGTKQIFGPGGTQQIPGSGVNPFGPDGKQDIFGPDGIRKFPVGPGGEQHMFGPGGTQNPTLGPGGTQQMFGPGGTEWNKRLGPGGTKQIFGPGGTQQIPNSTPTTNWALILEIIGGSIGGLIVVLLAYRYYEKRR